MKSGSNVIFPASLAGGAAILSVLTGIISGVSAGAVLLRGGAAALSALGFALFSGWIIKKYLPELAALGGSDAEEEMGRSGPPPEGSRVNIVMPEEAPRSSGLQEGEAGSGIPPAAGGEQASFSDGAIQTGPAAPGISSSEGVPVSPAAVDGLPSLDTLELTGGSSSSDEEGPAAEELASPGGSSSGNQVDLGGNNDPAEIAKAVKTVLKRDQQQ